MRKVGYAGTSLITEQAADAREHLPASLRVRMPGVGAHRRFGAAPCGASLWAPFAHQHLLILCLCHVLVVFKLFQTLLLLKHLSWRSVICAYDSERTQMVVPVF